MDAENDNDQPNSSSASASSSSSNNSSSSNLLGHLPMLPFMRSTDDDEPVADHLTDGNVDHHNNDDNNDLNEEPMPLQPPLPQPPPPPPVTQAMAMATAAQPASASVLQSTMAPITTTATAATGAGTSTASSTSSVGREEPMVGAEQLAVLSSSSSASSLPLPQTSLPPPPPPPPLSSASSSSISTSYFATTSSSHTTTRLPPSAFLPSANPSQVIFSPFLFDMPAVISTPTHAPNVNKSLSPSSSLPLPSPFSPTISSQNFTHLMSPMSDSNTPPLLTSSSPSSSAASSSSPSSSSSVHQIHYNLAQSQLSLFHEQDPIPTTSFSISSQQQQQLSPHQASSPPPTPPQPTSASTIIESTTVVQSPSPASSLLLQHNTEHAGPGQSQQQGQVVEQQQLTAQIINRNDIADTIDASAVIVQPLETNAEEIGHQPHIYPQEAASEAEVEQQQQHQQQQQNNIQLDDNDNNDFDVDLNIRNDEAVAVVASSSSSASVAVAQQQQLQRTQSLTLDTSASGSAGPSSSTSALGEQIQLHTPQLPTTLPLLFQQQQQQQQPPPPPLQQQSEESKHLPSFDHHYHNPREFHLHAHPYQHPCVYPYGFRSNSPSHNNNNNTNGAHINSGSSLNTNNIMFGNSMSSDHRNHHGSSTSGLGGVVNTNSSPQVVDRLKMLYPNVNENETPLPRCWSPHDKCLSIGLSQNNLRVHFKGVGKQSNDAASVRTAHPIPPACGIYYFEVEIISKGKNGYMGIGLTAQQFRMNRLPGWDKQSYGYHGDDGNSFSSSGHGQSYGPTFTTGDVIGCCVNFVNNTCFYTKNGIDLGIAFRDLPNKLYPTVGLQTPGEEVDANFGQEPFKFDQIEEMMKQMRAEMTANIYDSPLPAEQGDPTTLLQKLVSSYLVHNGYSQTAEAFCRHKTGQNLREDISSIRNRQRILKLVMAGKIGLAIEQTLRSYPGLLENNKNLWFMLKIRQFIEMINGSDIENGNGRGGGSSITSSNGSLLATNIEDHPSTSGSTIAVTKTTTTTASTNNTTNLNNNNNNSNNNTTANNLTIATVVNSPTTTTAVSSSSPSSSPSSTVATNTVAAATTATITTPAATTIINAQNSSHMTVIHTDNDIKTQTNLVEHCSATNDAPSTIGKSNNDNDYLNDVEMENNGQHTTNGNVCKNGNTNNFNDSIDADEEMDVDVSPAVKNFSHGIERILEFGKELSQMGTQLDKEKKMSDDEKRMMENAFSLIAYSNPWASPLGWQLCPSKREPVCRALNSAILESMNYAKMPPLEYCVAHANELLKVMAQASLGACAFVNIADVFPKN